MTDRTKKSERKKKGSRYRDAPVPFPVPIATVTGLPSSRECWFHYTGTLQDGLVTVNHSGDLTCLYKMGFFGRGLFSRGLPCLYKHMVTMNIPSEGTKSDPCSLRIMRRRMYIRHRAWQKAQSHATEGPGRQVAQTDSEDDEFDSDGEYDEPGMDQPTIPTGDAVVPDTSLPLHENMALPSGPNLDSNCDTAGQQGGMETGVYQSDHSWDRVTTEASWEIPAAGLQTWLDKKTSGEQADVWNDMEADVDFWTSDNTGSNVGEIPDNTGSNVGEIPVNSGSNFAEIPDNTGSNVGEHHHSEIAAVADMECQTSSTVPGYVCDRSNSGDDHCTVENHSSTEDCVHMSVCAPTQGKVGETEKAAEDICDETGDAHPSECVGACSWLTCCPSPNGLHSNMMHTPECKKNHIPGYSSQSTSAQDHTQAGEVIHPDCEHTQAGDVIHPDCDHKEQGDVIHPDCDHKEPGDIIHPDSEHTHAGDVIYPDCDHKETGEVIRPDCEHTERGEIIHPYCDSEDDDGEYLVIDDSDIEDGPVRRRYKNKYSWRPVMKQNPYPYPEPLLLTLEEAFFLAYGFGCLTIVDANQRPMTLTSIWRMFCAAQRTFVPSYVAYHYLRSRGWVPKPGLLFGVDFVLYKEGPPFYHGSYSVVVKTVRAGSLHEVVGLQPRSLSWNAYTGLNRVTEHVGKDLMFCYVIMPADLHEDEMHSPNCISKFKVKLQTSTRWIASQDREKAKSPEDTMPASP